MKQGLPTHSILNKYSSEDGDEIECHVHGLTNTFCVRFKEGAKTTRWISLSEGMASILMAMLEDQGFVPARKRNTRSRRAP